MIRRIQILAFRGMNQQWPPTQLSEEGMAQPREIINFRPHILPTLVPREVLVYHYEDSSANTDWPYRKSAG
jgi:hypothetical protein